MGKSKEQQYVPFGDLEVNDIFILSPKYSNDLYTKSYLVNSYNAINHRTGKAEYFGDITMVIKVGKESIEKR